MALSGKPWLCYQFMGKYHITPMSYAKVESAAPFNSDQCPDGIATISGGELKIIAPERLGEHFTQSVMKLKYTPRKISIHPYTSYLVINEMETCCLTTGERELVRKRIAEETKDEEYLELDERKVGYYRAKKDTYASCIRIVNPETMETILLQEFDSNEVVFSQYITNTLGNRGDTYLIVGTAIEPKLKPRSCQLGFIKTY